MKQWAIYPLLREGLSSWIQPGHFPSSTLGCLLLYAPAYGPRQAFSFLQRDSVESHDLNDLREPDQKKKNQFWQIELRVLTINKPVSEDCRHSPPLVGCSGPVTAQCPTQPWGCLCTSIRFCSPAPWMSLDFTQRSVILNLSSAAAPSEHMLETYPFPQEKAGTRAPQPPHAISQRQYAYGQSCGLAPWTHFSGNPNCTKLTQHIRDEHRGPHTIIRGFMFHNFG